MVCKKSLVSGLNPDDVFDDRVHLGELVVLLGPPPLEFIKRSPVGYVFWDVDGMPLEPRRSPHANISAGSLGRWKDLAPIPHTTLEQLVVDIQGADVPGFLGFLRKGLAP